MEQSVVGLSIVELLLPRLSSDLSIQDHGPLAYKVSDHKLTGQPPLDHQSMSYSEDAVLAKLSTLSETQDSIVGISQWILFHRRYADQTAQVWSKVLHRAPNSKKLGLVYLANEVVQQAKAKKKTEFVEAFAKCIGPALSSAYKTSTTEIKTKIKRVFDVWVQRQIFSDELIADISRSFQASASVSGSGSLISTASSASLNGLFGSVPAKLKSLVDDFQALGDISAVHQIVQSAISEYTGLIDSETLPSPPVYASQLSKLVSSLANAHKRVQQATELRANFVRTLQTLLEAEKKNLELLENHARELTLKKESAQSTIVDVEKMLVGDTGNSPTTPAYSPLTSDDDQSPKRQKVDGEGLQLVESSTEAKNPDPAPLDPKVAEFLSSLIKNERGSEEKKHETVAATESSRQE